MTTQAPARRRRLAFSEQFQPKLLTVLREGYRARDLIPDALAGLTVAIVALPLSMAIAIASGLAPQHGLYAAIVGGFLVSALGGSRFQVGGPAGAFIVLVGAAVADIGVAGMLLATILSGAMLVCAGLFRLGTYIKFIPYPVTVGFTAGIAVIIFVSQLPALLGLQMTGEGSGVIERLAHVRAALGTATPAALGLALGTIAVIIFVSQLPALLGLQMTGEGSGVIERLAHVRAALGTATPAALGLALGTIAVIQGLKRLAPRAPGMLIAIALAALAAALGDLPVATVAGRFGDLPRALPVPAPPPADAALLLAALPYAFSFALLGAIESLLSAVVADGMTGRRHRSNAELVAQGIANIAAGLFGAMCVTGTIARTATNVRAGSRGPVSGMLHALFLALALAAAAPLAGHIPLAALAGVLAVVAWNMAERSEFAALLRASRGDAVVLLATFLLTIFRGLTEAIVAGFALGGALFIRRMAESARVDVRAPLVERDRADEPRPYDPSEGAVPGVTVYRIKGAFFFGAAASVGAVLERIADTADTLVLDLSEVPFLDSSAARVLAGLARRCERRGLKLCLTGWDAEMRVILRSLGVRGGGVRYFRTIEAALASRAVQGHRTQGASPAPG